jgi:hypothetical protein
MVGIMRADTMRTSSIHQQATRAFWRHFVEMIVAMLVSMVVFGTVVSLVFAALGHANLLHYVGLRGFLMSTYMVVGMGIWMRYRGHGWASVEEMGAAMYLPFFVLIWPFEAGLIGEAGFLVLMHVLMLPCMLAVMFHRRYEYSRDHGRHAVHHAG